MLDVILVFHPISILFQIYEVVPHFDLTLYDIVAVSFINLYNLFQVLDVSVAVGYRVKVRYPRGKLYIVYKL